MTGEEKRSLAFIKEALNVVISNEAETNNNQNNISYNLNINNPVLPTWILKGNEFHETLATIRAEQQEFRINK